MNERDYEQAEGIRRSDLWVMHESPEKFHWHMMNRGMEEPTPAMIFGSAVHKFLLEPHDFDNEYAILPEGIDRRYKAGKEAYVAFATDHPGRTILSREDWEKLMGMAEAYSYNPLAENMIVGQHEVPIFWTDPMTGEKCKCKADVVRKVDGKYAVVDYKTTNDASTERFNSEIFRYGYHVQAAMYTEGLQISLGLDYRPSFYFVAQEKKAPYSLNVIEVTEDVLGYGDSVYHELLQKYHDCKELDVWPGYCSDVANECWLPGWIGNDFEEEE